MPFNVAAGNSSGYNYASGRLDHQTYYKAIRVEQSHLERVILDRILAAWLDEAALIPGLLPDGLGPFAQWPHQWFWDGHEPHPESFELLVRNTGHIPKENLTLINAAVAPESGRCILSSPVSHSRVSEYVPKVWESLQPRHADFGLQVDSISPKDLWKRLNDVGIDEIDLLKLDCEGAEYLIISELSAMGHMDRIGWIRGEWHSRKDNLQLAGFLGQTHVFNIEPNHPHSVGMVVAHRF